MNEMFIPDEHWASEPLSCSFPRFFFPSGICLCRCLLLIQAKRQGKVMILQGYCSDTRRCARMPGSLGKTGQRLMQIGRVRCERQLSEFSKKELTVGVCHCAEPFDSAPLLRNKIPSPPPWIPAFAGMTKTTHPSFRARPQAATRNPEGEN